MASIAVTAVFLFLALRMAERTEDLFGPLLSKFGGPPLAFVFAGCALITAYAILDRARRWPVVDTLLRPVEILGVKGLPGYVAMVLTILFFATFPSLPRNDLTVIFVVLVAGCSEYGAWKLAQRRSTRTAVPAPAPDCQRSAPHPLEALPVQLVRRDEELLRDLVAGQPGRQLRAQP